MRQSSSLDTGTESIRYDNRVGQLLPKITYAWTVVSYEFQQKEVEKVLWNSEYVFGIFDSGSILLRIDFSDPENPFFESIFW